MSNKDKNTNYSEQSELIKKIQEKDCQRSFSFLLKQYEPLLKSYTTYFLTKYPEIPADRDDVMNQLRGDFYLLVKRYDSTKGKFFGAYVKEFLFLRTNGEVRKFANKSHLSMNYAKLDSDFEIIGTNQEDDHEAEIAALLKGAQLTDLEKYVTTGLMNGKTMQEMVKETGFSQNSIYSARTRARTKLSKSNKTNI